MGSCPEVRGSLEQHPCRWSRAAQSQSKSGAGVQKALPMDQTRHPRATQSDELCHSAAAPERGGGGVCCGRRSPVLRPRRGGSPRGALRGALRGASFESPAHPVWAPPTGGTTAINLGSFDLGVRRAGCGNTTRTRGAGGGCATVSTSRRWWDGSARARPRRRARRRREGDVKAIGERAKQARGSSEGVA